MRSLAFLLVSSLALSSASCAAQAHDVAPVATQPSIAWQSYSPEIFVRAKKEHKFVILDLEAVWCHWCHVMDHVTYSDPQVITLLNAKYIAVKVDQDSRPDISARYEDFGWPATIVFNADGGEIVKRQGYIPPGLMVRMLQAIIDDPTPGPSVRSQKSIEFGQQSSLGRDLKALLEQRLNANYDARFGGWGTIHKYLDWDAVEWSMLRARTGDDASGRRARQTLDGCLKLIDPVWGGIYQYSTDGDWDHPHFEKIMQFQAQGIRTYALAYAQWHDPAYLKAAKDIGKYLATFLTSPEGAFYTSQDADLVEGEHSASYFALDDASRRKMGVPRIDRHIYARENGWAIEALVTLADATGDGQALKDAVRAAQWVIANRSIEGGGFSHDTKDPAGPYLADTLAMGRAFLMLYSATTDRSWLDRAQAAADFMTVHFKAPDPAPGFVPFSSQRGSTLAATQVLDDNISVARCTNLLAAYAGKPADRASAQAAMRYVATPQVAQSHGPWVAGILLADSELSVEPLHVTIVGPKSDPAAFELFHQALATPVSYRRVEWWDPKAGALPSMDVEYPKLTYSAAFVCTANSCSSPMKDPKSLAARLPH